MKVYKSITDQNKPYNDKWIYKSYLFQNDNNDNLGTLILFKDTKSKLPYGITIIKGLQKKIGSKMIEVALNDTPEGILPSEERFISTDAIKMWNRISEDLVFKKEPIPQNKRIEHSQQFLNNVYKINLRRNYEIIPMKPKHIKDSIKIGSDELLKQNYTGTSEFLQNDLSRILIPTEKNKILKKSKRKP